MTRAASATLTAALLLAQPTYGQDARSPLSHGSVATAVERLKPGEFLWAPEIAPEGPVLIVVSLATQRAVVYRNGVPIGVSTASTGKEGYGTPPGIYSILEKDVDHRSNIYDDAPMPYMQRLTWSGVALHAGRVPGHPASHGCIRLPLEFAKQLYDLTRLGMTVVVTREPSLPRVAPEPSLIGSAPASAPTGAIVWNPDRSPSGPVSIVISAADQRAIVLRNGKEIGSAPVEITVPVPAVSAYSLVAIDMDGWRWLRLPLAGEKGTATSYRGNIKLDDAFRKAAIAILRPGATVVITPDTLRAGRTGEALDEFVAGPEG